MSHHHYQSTAHPFSHCHLSNRCRSHEIKLHIGRSLHPGLMEDSTDDTIADILLIISLSLKMFLLGYQPYYSPNSCHQYSQLPSCSTKTIPLNHKLPCSYFIVYQNSVLNTLTFLPSMQLRYCQLLFEICTSAPKKFVTILYLLDTIPTLKS